MVNPPMKLLILLTRKTRLDPHACTLPPILRKPHCQPLLDVRHRARRHLAPAQPPAQGHGWRFAQPDAVSQFRRAPAAWSVAATAGVRMGDNGRGSQAPYRRLRSYSCAVRRPSPPA